MLRHNKCHLAFVDAIKDPVHDDRHEISNDHAIDEPVHILEYQDASQHDGCHIQHECNHAQGNMRLYLLNRHADEILAASR